MTVLAERVVGRGLDTGFLSPDEVRAVAREGLARDRKSVV